MNFLACFGVLCSISLVWGQGLSQYGPAQSQSQYNSGSGGGGSAGFNSGSSSHQGMPYSFNYQVNAPEYANDYGHQEQSDGNVVRGSYRVALPDGRIQIVTYTADHDSGYQAQVEYQGEASYPDQPIRSNRPSGNNQGSYTAGRPSRNQAQYGGQ